MLDILTVRIANQCPWKSLGGGPPFDKFCSTGGQEVRILVGRGHYPGVRPMIAASQAIKRMRGRSRAVHVVANGWHYVVKPSSIGLRSMINEWLGAQLYQMFGIMTADVRPIRIPRSLAMENWPELQGTDSIGVASAFPVDPTSHAIYDFLPGTMAEQIANIDHIVGALAVDLWTGMTERRHCIYFRQGPWWTCAVDHKGMFGGTQWNCSGVAIPSNPAARRAYELVLTRDQIDLWSTHISTVKPEALYRLFRGVPDCWADAVKSFELTRLAELLLSRRACVPAMLRSVAGTSPIMVPVPCDNMTLNAPCAST